MKSGRSGVIFLTTNYLINIVLKAIYSMNIISRTIFTQQRVGARI